MPCSARIWRANPRHMAFTPETVHAAAEPLAGTGSCGLLPPRPVKLPGCSGQEASMANAAPPPAQHHKRCSLLPPHPVRLPGCSGQETSSAIMSQPPLRIGNASALLLPQTDGVTACCGQNQKCCGLLPPGTECAWGLPLLRIRNARPAATRNRECCGLPPLGNRNAEACCCHTQPVAVPNRAGDISGQRGPAAAQDRECCGLSPLGVRNAAACLRCCGPRRQIQNAWQPAALSDQTPGPKNLPTPAQAGAELPCTPPQQ